MYGYFTEVQINLRMRNFLQSTIFSAEFNSILTNKKFTKAGRYIHSNKLLERCYVLLRIIFPCMRVLLLADINHSGMDKVYYYLMKTKQCIEKKILYWLLENMPRYKFNSQYMEHTWLWKWWRKFIIKWLHGLLRKSPYNCYKSK